MSRGYVPRGLYKELRPRGLIAMSPRSITGSGKPRRNRFCHVSRIRLFLTIGQLVATNLSRLLHAVPIQVTDVGLSEVLRLRHAEESRLPKRLGLVVAIEPLTSIFRLANVDDWLSTVLVLSEKKVDDWAVQFPPQLACR
jgi:hypothetical protein